MRAERPPLVSSGGMPKTGPVPGETRTTSGVGRGFVAIEEKVESSLVFETVAVGALDPAAVVPDLRSQVDAFVEPNRPESAGGHVDEGRLPEQIFLDIAPLERHELDIPAFRELRLGQVPAADPVDVSCCVRFAYPGEGQSAQTQSCRFQDLREAVRHATPP